MDRPTWNSATAPSSEFASVCLINVEPMNPTPPVMMMVFLDRERYRRNSDSGTPIEHAKCGLVGP